MVLITVFIVVCGSIVEVDAIAVDNPHLSTEIHFKIHCFDVITVATCIYII